MASVEVLKTIVAAGADLTLLQPRQTQQFANFANWQLNRAPKSQCPLIKSLS